MYISSEIVRESENKVIKYYENLEKIEMYSVRLNSLSSIWVETSDSLKKRYKEHEIFAECYDLKGIAYDGVKVDGGQLPCSPVERVLSGRSIGVIKHAERIEKEMSEKKDLIIELKNENSVMNDVINKLDIYSKKIIELKYKEKMTYEALSFELHESRSNICKRNKKILKDITKYMIWMYPVA